MFLRHRFLSLIGLALLFCSAAISAAPKIQHWVNTDGMRIYMVQAPELPMVDVRLAFDAGSARDRDHPGLANFTSGMIEEGAAKMDAHTIASQFDALGAQFSQSAQRDTATLSLRTLTRSDILQPALKLFATVISEASFPQDAVERVREQILVGLENDKQSPGKIAAKSYRRSLFGNHPYAHPHSGTSDTIEQTTQADLIHFYRTHYTIANGLAVVVGNVDREQVEQLVRQVTLGLPSGKVLAPIPEVSALDAPSTQQMSYPSSQTHIYLGQPGYRRGDPDHFALYVGNFILGGSGLVSRISDEVREKRGLSYSAYSYFNPSRQAGTFTLGLQTQNSKADEALNVLKQTLEQFRSKGPSEKELLAAKRHITGGFPLKVDSNSDILGYVAMIAFYGLPLDYLDHFNDHVSAVTTEQIQNAFVRRIDPEKMVLVMVGGE
jgi:zinc protease